MRRFLLLILAIVFWPSQASAQVVFDTAVSNSTFGGSPLSQNITITSSANRAVIGCLMGVGAAVTSVSFTAGGVSGTLISGTSKVNAGSGGQIVCYVAVAPASGAQTCSFTFSTATTASLSCMSFSGVNQSTPTNNSSSVDSGFASSSTTGSITSNSGDLTFSYNACSAVDSAQTTNQTVKTTSYARADIGPGTGATTHTWSHAATNMWTAWGNIVQASGASSSRRVIVSGAQ